MTTIYIISLGLLVGGGALCYFGLKLYKLAQMLICAAIGGYIGLFLVQTIGRQEFYILALILTVLGGFLGYRYYKYSLYICVSLSSFLVTFSYFWRQALASAKESLGEVLNMKNLITENLSGQMSLQQILDSFDVIRNAYNSNWITVFKSAEEIIKHGLFVSAAVAMVAGILTIWIGDYVIMVVSAAFGSMLLVNMIEMFAEITPMMHLLLLVVIGISGVIVQFSKRRR